MVKSSREYSSCRREEKDGFNENDFTEQGDNNSKNENISERVTW